MKINAVNNYHKIEYKSSNIKYNIGASKKSIP